MPKTKAKTRKKTLYAAPALSKGLDILELMTTKAEGLNLGEIAKKLGRSKGEIFRMLVVLEERGYITLDSEADVYSLTLKVFELAHQHPHVKRLTSAAAPVMRKLSRTTDQSCHLVTYYNGQGIVVVQQDSPTERTLSVRQGAHAALANTCSGHLHLAYANPALLEEMFSAQTGKNKKLLTRALVSRIRKRIRESGFEKVKSQQIQGVIDIGYPIFDYSGHMLAALCIPFLEYLDESQRVSFDEAQRHLESASRAISEALGYVPPK